MKIGFKRIQNTILFSHVLVLLFFFLVTLIIISIFIKKTYFHYSLEDLSHDAALFIDLETKQAVARHDTQGLNAILRKSEGEYAIDVFDRAGKWLANAKGDTPAEAAVIGHGEFNIDVSRGYGYAVRSLVIPFRINILQNSPFTKA